MLKDVCNAIIDSAFKSSQMPIILSLENHCSAPQQQRMAELFIEIFGDNLLAEPLPSHPLESGILPPSPHSLRNKILLKGSKSTAARIGASLRRQMHRLTDEVDRLAGPRAAAQSEKYANERETTADSEIDSSVS